MSALARFLHSTPATRRAYSSFFSSKPGGGRYFNSAKPPKSVVAEGAPNNKNAKVDPAPDPAGGGAKAGGGGGSNSGATAGKSPNQMINANANQGPQSASPSSSSSSPTTDRSNPGATATPERPFQLNYYSERQHPIVKPMDFKLLQFFSLHRPLLLLSQPSSILHSAPSNTDFTEIKTLPSSNTDHPWMSQASPDDADAAAARQLTRALTMSHAGATAAWEDTLRRLGLDVEKDADRVELRQQLDREWQDVMMDSVKRKRRKKMKKHKLKKRRKETRAARVKIGR